MANPASSPEVKERRIAISLGDPAGIGAEVTLKALAALRRNESESAGAAFNPLLVGCRRWLEQTYGALRSVSAVPLADPASLDIFDLPLAEPIHPGQSSATSGAASFAWLSRAAELVLEGRCQALTTAPIAKQAWHAAGHPYPGQTERLAELAGVVEASMLFTARAPHGSWRLNTLLATTHIPLSAVASSLDAPRVEAKLNSLLTFCQRFAERPRLVVAGLNPHAGEAGQLGHEEQTWLEPLLAAWRLSHPGVELVGPLPPDTCWLGAGAAWADPAAVGDGADGYLAMYHDQGLIPVKLLAFDAAVNTTLGLPFLRTSPDHGTAFAIAGQGIARPQSMEAALQTAWELG
ncbi:MAG: 4-hydroxythreonine-4-phosphate dehydrogenase PdxA [Cyanobacteria bacterium]|nr:4-hydroxythreonine-4-phosphate dehydrogenase PdxA [Cyanobacteriota bacterium]